MPTLNANLLANSGASGTSGTLTTGAAAASGAAIFALVSWWSSTTPTPTFSGGSLTWSKLIQVNNGGGDRFAIWKADAPAGLASGTVLTTASLGSGDGGWLIGGVSFTSVGSLVTTGQSTTATGTSWTSGAATNSTVGDLYLGGSGLETAATGTSTAVNGTELHDRWQATAAQGFATGYLISGSVASQAITGTFTQSSTASTGALVIYADAAGAAAVAQDIVMAPMR